MSSGPGNALRRGPRSRNGVLLLVAYLASGCTPEEGDRTVSPDGPADRLFLNARIWTGDADRPEVAAMAIREGRILALGSDGEVRELSGPSTRIEDLGGRRVIPGLHDAHWHLPSRRTADLAGAGEVEEILERLDSFLVDLSPDAWVTGRGWTPEMFPGQMPHRRYLDRRYPDRPALITDRDGHVALANTFALELAGVDSGTPNPPGGEVERDEEGEPTGLLKEGAMSLVRRLIPPSTPEEVAALVREEMERAAALGLVAVQMANAPSEPVLTALRRYADADSLLLRFRIAVPFTREASPSDLARWVELRDAHAEDLHIRYGIAKGMLDGTVDGGTAHMLEPYAVGGGTGLPMWEEEALRETVARYERAGLQIQLHAIGDGAIRMALDAFQADGAPNGTRDRRHRIEHVEVPHPDDLRRFARLGVIASTQAIFATPDITALTSYAPRLGPERAARAMPFRSLDEAGALQAFGSDYPVFPMDPLLGIYTAVTRQLPDGTPEGGWHPEERISVERALRHYTRGSAYAAFRDEEMGTLRPGSLADLVVLSEDVLEGPPTRLLETKILLTLMGGRDTHRDPDFLATPQRDP